MTSFADTTRLPINRLTSLRTLLDRAFLLSRPLTILGGIMLVTFAATLVGIVADPRVITGVPAWVKPAKFALSVSVYCFTFVWLLGFVENRPALVRLTANVTVISITVEMIAIITQAARGTTSHFNNTTTFNSLVWIAMGSFILLVWMMNLLLGILLIRQRMTDRAFAWSLRLGVLISSIGMAIAFLMVRPTPEQVAVIANHGPRIVGAHSVGVADGGPGLPFLGWSTVGGDLRIAHFAGLHALQMLPFLGWIISRRRGVLRFLTSTDRLALVWTSGLAYLGAVALLTWQALRGQSVIHPDAKTIAVGAALIAGVVTSMAITSVRIWNRNREECVLASAIHILSH